MVVEDLGYNCCWEMWGGCLKVGLVENENVVVVDCLNIWKVGFSFVVMLYKICVWGFEFMVVVYLLIFCFIFCDGIVMILGLLRGKGCYCILIFF